MKLAAFILLCAIFGARAVPLRVGYYRAAAIPQQSLEVEESEEADTEISEEDFNQDLAQDDDSDEQEPAPQFNKLFPLPQVNSPGYNMPLSAMMGEIAVQGWNVPKHPQQIPRQNNKNRGRDELDQAYDDDDDDDDGDDDDDEEDEEDDDTDAEDDLPDWQKLFPNSPESQGQGPPSGLVDTSATPELPAQYRSGVPGSRIVYVPARQLRQQVRPGGAPVRRQYVMRAPAPTRVQYAYRPTASYMNRQPMVVRGRPQMMYAQAASSRRPQQLVYYMPVRRGSYSPYTSAYVPRYRY